MTSHVAFVDGNTADSNRVKADWLNGVNDFIYSTLPGNNGSAEIGFIQAGTGAIARTLQSKEREIVSITDFKNANGTQVSGTDGTDQSTGIQAAFNASRAVYIPPGEYKYTTKLTVPNSLYLIYGAGFYSQLCPTGCIGLDVNIGQAAILTMRDFTIDGQGNTSTTTGRGIQVLGDLTTSFAQGIRIENVSIFNINTGIYLRSASDIDIHGCAIGLQDVSGIGVYNGIICKGQVILCRIHDNDINCRSALGSGGSTGVLVDSAFDYNPNGNTEHRPEDVQIYHNRLYGFSIGIDAVRCVLFGAQDNDIDNTQLIGIRMGTLGGNVTVANNWILLGPVTATNGIQVVAQGASSGATLNIKGNHILGPSASQFTLVTGIAVGTNQKTNITENTINLSTPGTGSVDIYLAQGNANVNYINVLNNYLLTATVQANPISIYVATTIAGGLIKIDGNFLYGTLYVAPTVNLAQFDIGFNTGTFSTRIRGQTLLAQNATQVVQNFNAIGDGAHTKPNNFDVAGTTFLATQAVIYGPPINLGSIFAVADATSITINCTNATHAACVLSWEVSLFPYQGI